MKHILSISFMLVCSNAHAHFGHVGELAGHGHWVEIGVLVAGSILAAILAKGKATSRKEEPEADVEADSGEQSA